MANLEINQLRALAALIDFGGVTRAAEMLNLTQGAVSIQLKRLEETVEEKLFHRQGRSLRPTPAGEAVLRYARQILELNDTAVTQIKHGHTRETVEFGIPTDIAYPFLTEILKEFSKRHPHIRVRPHFNNSVALFQAYHQGELGSGLIKLAPQSDCSDFDHCHEMC